MKEENIEIVMRDDRSKIQMRLNAIDVIPWQTSLTGLR